SGSQRADVVLREFRHAGLSRSEMDRGSRVRQRALHRSDRPPRQGIEDPLFESGVRVRSARRGNPAMAGCPAAAPAAEAGGGMNERSVMKFGYVRQILGSIRKHRGEPALLLICLITISLVYVWAASSLQRRVTDITRELAIGVAGSLVPLIAAMLVLQLAVASWRLYRNQQVALATKQTLLDLNEFDRAESEHKLQAH